MKYEKELITVILGTLFGIILLHLHDYLYPHTEIFNSVIGVIGFVFTFHSLIFATVLILVRLIKYIRAWFIK